MGIGPVIYGATQVVGPCTEVDMRWAGPSGTQLLRGASIRTLTQTTFAGFAFGPGLDADLFRSSPINPEFAGILSDDSVGVVNLGDRITVFRPHCGSIVWSRVATGVVAGNGVNPQDSAIDQGMLNGGGYLNNDFAYALLSVDALDNPLLADLMAPIKFTYGVTP